MPVFSAALARQEPTGKAGFGPTGAAVREPTPFGGIGLKRQKPETECRKWPRLPLAIPVFVRSNDEKGNEVLEFATALNISAGGALVVVRRSIPLSSPLLLQIPSAPLISGSAFPSASKSLRARAVRVIHVDGYHLLGLKFSRPLTEAKPKAMPIQRKVTSQV
jgi:hypothetical protein